MSIAYRGGVRLRKLEVSTLPQLENAFTTLKKERVDALLVNPNLVIFQNRDRLVAPASAIRVPVITEIQEFAEAGGVITFGPDVPSSSRRGAYFVDRILKGGKPAELPIEQPTRFNLVVNVKAAKAWGLTVPESMISRATAVIK
jgi:putative ABC transport system substrate-binding protein